MASVEDSPSFHKTVVEICDTVNELKEYYLDSQLPITDDCVLLQRLCEKIEYFFQLDLKESTGLLRGRKHYWDYLCKCLSEKRNLHDGIRFVKGIAEIKTSEGRGRAFIRFCLMHRCLADSIQRCVLNEKVTREWYGERSPLRNEAHVSYFTASLYELNDVQFELNSIGHELDVGWPTFAVKGHETFWRLSNRTMSMSSLSSFMSTQNEQEREMSPFRVHSKSASEVQSSSDAYVAQHEELQRQNSILQSLLNEKEKSWATEREKLEEQLHEMKKRLDDAMRTDLKNQAEAKLRADTENQRELTSVEKQMKMIEKGLTDSHKSALTLLNTFEVKVSTVDNKIKELARSHPGLADCTVVASDELVPVSANAVREFQEDVASVQFAAMDLIMAQNGFLDKISNLTKMNNDLQHTALSVATENKDLKEALEEFKENLDVCKSKKGISDATHEKMEEQISALKDALGAAKEILEIKDLEIIKLRTELKVKWSQDANENGDGCERSEREKLLKDQVADLLTQIQTYHHEKVRLTKVVSHIESSYAELQKRAEEKTKLLKETEVQLTHMNEKMRSLLRLIDVQDGQITDLKRTLEMCDEEKNNLTMQMRQLNDLLQEAEKIEVKDIKNTELQLIQTNEFEGTSSSDEKESASCEKDITEKPKEVPGPSTQKTEQAQSVVIKTVSRTLSRLQSLVEERTELQQQLKVNKEMTSSLLNKVAEQEQQLANVTLELTETQEFIGKLRSSFSKLQTNEAILRFELKEKRHLLTKLKGQLESSRVQWKQVQQKNSETEAQWQSLRDEIDSRRGKPSSSEGETLHENSQGNPDDELLGACGNEAAASFTNPDLLADISSSPDDSSPLSSEAGDPRDRRLKFLEEQCRMLYDKLLNSAKYRAALDKRLTSLHDHYGSADTEGSASVLDEQEDEVTEDCEVDLNDVTDSATEISQNCELETEDTSVAIQPIENPVIDDFSVEVEVVKLTSSSPSPDLDIKTNEATVEVSCGSSSPQVKVSAYDMAHALPKRIEKLRKEKETLQLKLKKLHGDLKSAEARETNCKARIELLQVDKDSLSKQLEDLRKIQTTDKTTRESKFVEVIAAKDALQSRLLLVEEQLKERTGTIMEVQQKLEQSRQEMDLTKQSLEQEISALHFQLNTETLRHQNVSKECSEQEQSMKRMQEHINKQEVMIVHLEESLAKVKEEREAEQQEQWKQLEELKLSINNRQDESINELQSQLEDERNQTQKLHTNLEEFRFSHDKSMEHLQEEVKQLQSDNELLKKHIVKLTKEKDMLWKERHRLSCEKKMRASSRWMYSGDVIHCFGCNIEFGFLLRKHHCRLCGQIFCYNCANNWVSTTASSQNVRACDECFAKHKDQEVVPLNVSVSNSDEDEPSLSAASLTDSQIEVDAELMSDEFHIITDEELTESLNEPSASRFLNEDFDSSLNVQEVWTQSQVRLLSELEEETILKIAARKKYVIPLMVTELNEVLTWSFKSKPKSIGFGVLYHSSLEESKNNPSEIILSPLQCNSHLHAITGQLTPKKTGIYSFVFDNTFSRFTAKEVILTFTVEHATQ